MTDHNADVKRLTEEAAAGIYTRRQIIAGALALGLTASAVNGILKNAVLAQDATPAGPPAANGPVMVSIVNQEMSHDDIAAAIEEEGEVTVGNWTYTANDQLVERFQGYVQETYGKDITLNYTASQSPSTYITELYTAVGSGNDSPYDVMAIEENYWAEVQLQQKNQSTKFMEDFLPSGLIPNAERVIDTFKHEPTSIAFQASATPGVNFHKDTARVLDRLERFGGRAARGQIAALDARRHHDGRHVARIGRVAWQGLQRSRRDD